jgi:hypothetical protein
MPSFTVEGVRFMHASALYLVDIEVEDDEPMAMVAYLVATERRPGHGAVQQTARLPNGFLYHVFDADGRTLADHAIEAWRADWTVPHGPERADKLP